MTGTCESGYAAVGVKADGSLECDPYYDGTVTSVNTGTGLSGGPITQSGTISLAASYQDGSAYDSRFVNENQLACVSTDMLQDHAVTGDKLESSYQSGSAYDTRFVNTDGDTMTDTLNLPADGLIVGTNQLVCAGGNVGIGTTGPSARLDVYSNEPNSVGVLRVRQDISTNLPTMSIQQIGSGGNAGDNQGLLLDVAGVGGGRSLTIRNSGIDRLIVQNDGNVGIGTTTPSEKLEVHGNIFSKGYLYLGGSMSGSNAMYIYITTVEERQHLKRLMRMIIIICNSY